MSNPILGVAPLEFPWQTKDPFLVCVHHVDDYPSGNDRLGPAASLAGRNIGQDFAGKDGWRMYHGQAVPGFPQHPHRGFETVTFEREKPNRLELFQIWLNLPAKSKFAPPYFTMFWDRDMPRYRETDANGRHVEVTLVAGSLGGLAPPAPPPDSWAARADADVAIWSIKLEPDAAWTIPPARDAGVGRRLYFFSGTKVDVAGHIVAQPSAIDVASDKPVGVAALDGPVEILVLQGRPIAEPVAQYGPFVMNSRAELEQAFNDYRRTQFGGWPFRENEPVHPRGRGRFARHADGKVEEAPV